MQDFWMIFLTTATTPAAATTTTKLNGHKREALAEFDEKPLNILTKDIDVLGELSLLALERFSIKGDDEDNNDDDGGDDDDLELSDDEELEKAMAASISSIKSHEILSKMVTEFPNNEHATTSLLADSFTASTDTTKVPTEMDFYRRASHLESYAAERLKDWN
uniref:Uncharacterized protein n=1 Tax=Panagrolaimus superbus TaxID=310955 RepID=A0A914Y9Y5_9BILA